jgi:hypothetical protein
MGHLLSPQAYVALFGWLKVMFADLLGEKNIVHWLKKYGL